MDYAYSTTMEAVRKSGKHFTLDERGQIQALHREGFSLRAIAARVGCSHTAIHYELKRGTPERQAARGRSPQYTANRRNGYTPKVLKTSAGEVPISVPRDRDGSFTPQIVPKRQTDVSSIEGKVLAMYARGMSQRDISSTIDDIYGFMLSAEQISHITDSVLDELHEWQNRPLKAFYPFVFVDCIYVSMRGDKGVSDQAVYVILGYDLKGKKDV
ncbi:putative transposase, Mutator family, partial [Selenomonas sp. oral taxon 137 str. F0430]|uniref:IS256 family transposase n=1 Tax=Selenomonas sp. oral taxon 137 TaxID=712531 RepID=UPI0001EB20C5